MIGRDRGGRGLGFFLWIPAKNCGNDRRGDDGQDRGARAGPLSCPTFLIGHPWLFPTQRLTNAGTEEKDTGFPLNTAGMTEGGTAGRTEGKRRAGQGSQSRPAVMPDVVNRASMAVSMQRPTNAGTEEKDTGFPLNTAGMTKGGTAGRTEEGNGGQDGRATAGRTGGQPWLRVRLGRILLMVGPAVLFFLSLAGAVSRGCTVVSVPTRFWDTQGQALLTCSR